jgi:hypothetical protein
MDRREALYWNDDDFDVLADGTVVGRIYEAMQSASSNSSSVIAVVPYKTQTAFISCS